MWNIPMFVEQRSSITDFPENPLLLLHPPLPFPPLPSTKLPGHAHLDPILVGNETTLSRAGSFFLPEGEKGLPGQS